MLAALGFGVPLCASHGIRSSKIMASIASRVALYRAVGSLMPARRSRATTSANASMKQLDVRMMNAPVGK